MSPKVTFVVPCYRLAHLLPDCVGSILAQTFSDFEVLVMDDCSPDQTANVTATLRDTRVKHVRNETNLGHLRNYNKGIELARGEYIWLISADDQLRRPYILERYLKLMDRNPNAGYACCPAMGLQNGRETSVQKYSVHGDRNIIFNGREFFIRLLSGNSVIAASGMVRRKCYDQLGKFPLDMPFAADWYLWCLFALHFDVAYFSEPMVHYRQHELSMTTAFHENDPRVCTSDDIRALWRVKLAADQAGYPHLADIVEFHAIDRCALFLSTPSTPGSGVSYTLEDFQQDLNDNVSAPDQRARVASRVYSKAADEYFWRNQFSEALAFYELSLKHDPLRPKVRVQYALLRAGTVGIRIRKAQFAVRHLIRTETRANNRWRIT